MQKKKPLVRLDSEIMKPLSMSMIAPPSIRKPMPIIVDKVKSPIPIIVEELKKEINKNDFLNNIFGKKTFNFDVEFGDLIDEIEDDLKLDKILGKTKNELENILKGKFNNSQSLISFIKSI